MLREAIFKSVAGRSSYRNFALFPMRANPIYSPSCGRNRVPILEMLRLYAPKNRRENLSHLFCLEISSGCGEHVGYFASKSFGNEPVIWQPSDVSATYFQSVMAQSFGYRRSKRSHSSSNFASTYFAGCSRFVMVTPFFK